MSWEIKEPRRAKITYRYMTRGRSAVVAHFVDEDGKSLQFSTKGIGELFLAVSNGFVSVENGAFVGKFVKCKRGSSYRWEVCEDV